jgi:hypothetical protein
MSRLRTSPPAFEKEYIDYIKSREILGALIANRMPDFASMKDGDFRNAIEVLSLYGNETKEHLVRMMESHFRNMLEVHDTRLWNQAQRCLRERPELMLTSKVKRDPSRDSFTVFPLEIRNMIYHLALFDPPPEEVRLREMISIGSDGRQHITLYPDQCVQTPSGVGRLEARGDHHVAGDLKINCYNGRFSFTRSRLHYRSVNYAELRVDRTISTLHVIGALNKQVRQEVQTFFWARTRILLHFARLTSACVGTRQFLEKIGPLGRSSLAGLDVDQSLEDSRHQDYQDMIPELQKCKNLQDLTLFLPIKTILGSADRNAMEDFLLRGKPLDSPSMNGLVKALHSMPRLRFVRLHTVHLKVYRHRDGSHHFGSNDSFADFAFSGAREALLVQELRTLLRAHPREDAHFEVTGTQQHTLDYEEWRDLGCHSHARH